MIEEPEYRTVPQWGEPIPVQLNDFRAGDLVTFRVDALGASLWNKLGFKHEIVVHVRPEPECRKG